MAACCVVGPACRAATLDAWPNPADTPRDQRVWVDGDAFAASSFRSVSQAVHDEWASTAPRSGRNLELAWARSSLGFARGGWSLTLGTRAQVIAQAENETLQIYGAQRTGAALPVEQSYRVDYALQGFQAQTASLGTAWSRGYNHGTLHWGLRLNWLNAQRITQQQAVGLAHTQPDSSLAITGSTSRQDSHMDTAAQGFAGPLAASPAGSGYAVDLGWRYQHANGWEVDWAVTDAFSDITWQHVPEVTLRGSSTFNGSFPSGRKAWVHMHQTLPALHQVRVEAPLGRHYGQASVLLWGDTAMARVGMRHPVGQGWEAAWDYDLLFQSVGLALHNAYVGVALRTDALDWNNARVLSLQVTASAQWK